LTAADRVKALLRRGTARIHKSELAAAKSDFLAALALEPNNRQAREELKVGGVAVCVCVIGEGEGGACGELAICFQQTQSDNNNWFAA
jgi:hypothetical protein